MAERSLVYGLLSCLQTCSAFSCLRATWPTAPALKRLVSLFSKCGVSPIALLILHLQRTASCCDVCGWYAHFSVGGHILALPLCTQNPPSCRGGGRFQLPWGCLCLGTVRKRVSWNENKCWVFGMLSQFRLALMSSLNKQCAQRCLLLASSGVGP